MYRRSNTKRPGSPGDCRRNRRYFDVGLQSSSLIDEAAIRAAQKMARPLFIVSFHSNRGQSPEQTTGCLMGLRPAIEHEQDIHPSPSIPLGYADLTQVTTKSRNSVSTSLTQVRTCNL